MPVSIIQRDIKLKCKPTNGLQAYGLIGSLFSKMQIGTY